MGGSTLVGSVGFESSHASRSRLAQETAEEPTAAKKTVRRHKRVVPTAEHFDLVVIGGGPGGYAAALYASAAGLTAAVVEKDKVGGTCLHRGCIPAKEFLETAHTFRTVAEAGRFGIKAGEPTIDFSISQARKQTVVDNLWKGLAGLLKKKKITVVHGTGMLTHGNLVKVSDGTELKGTNVILA